MKKGSPGNHKKPTIGKKASIYTRFLSGLPYANWKQIAG